MRNTGLALAIVGGVATIVGFAGFVGSNTCGSDATNSDGAGGPSTMDGCASTATHVAWAAVLFGGLATGVAGLVMRSGATPSVTVVPFGAATATARTPSAKTSFPSGLGLRFTF